MSGRIYIVALCGGGDRPIAALGGQTAFAAAATPNMDAMVRGGTLGSVTVIAPDIPPESDSGAMALLGYDPLVYYTGRGPLEGLGMGFWDPAGASVAFRINFASCDPVTGRLDRRTSRDLTDHELQILVTEIREQVKLAEFPDINYSITAFGRHRGIVCLTSRSTPLTGDVSNTDPGFRKLGPFGVPNEQYTARPQRCLPLTDCAGARCTAQAVNAFVAESARVLAASAVNRERTRAGRLPANVLLFRDAGHTLPALPRFTAATGLQMALYGQVPAERGLCQLFGGRFVRSRPEGGQTDEEFFAALLEQVTTDPADLVFIHLKGPDEPGHDGKPLEKVAAIESIDRLFVGELLDRLTPADLAVLTCDHATPCELGIHAPDPVPIVLYGRDIAHNGHHAFSESEAVVADFPIRRAHELLTFVTGLVRERR